MATLNCPPLAQLTRLAQHRLDGRELHEVAPHIAHCKPCQQFFDNLSAASPEQLSGPIPITVGPFRILGRLGGGGMGEALFAWQPLMRRFCVVKMIRTDRVLEPEFRDRFKLEIQSQTALSDKSEHIMPVLSADVCKDSNALYMAMPYFPGQTLEQRLADGAAMPVPDALHIARQFLEGLVAAHHEGILHRDIKPSNIYLENREDAPVRVRIIDFGLTRSLDSAAGMTQAGVALGTPGYMSPENLSGAEVDARTDLFSFGCTLYRMLTGRLPFPGLDPDSRKPSWSAYRQQVIDPAFVPLAVLEINPHAPRSLSDLVASLLAKAPADRLASAQLVLDAVRRIQDGAPAEVTRTLASTRPIADPKPEPAPVVNAPAKKRTVGCTITITLAACVAIAMSLGAYALHQRGEARYAKAVKDHQDAQNELAELRKSIQEAEALLARQRSLENNTKKQWTDFLQEHQARQREIEIEREKELARLAAANDAEGIARLKEKRRLEKDEADRLEREQLAAKLAAEAQVQAEVAKLKAQVQAASQAAQQREAMVSHPAPVYYPPYHYRYYWGW